MYYFVSDTKEPQNNIRSVEHKYADPLSNNRGICHIAREGAAQKDEIESLLTDLKKHFPRRSIHIVFQPRLQYISKKNKIEYCSSFTQAETMLVTEAFNFDKNTLPNTRDIIAHMKHCSGLKSAKRAYNFKDIIDYIKNDIPQDGIVVLVGFKNTTCIMRELDL